jgi:hypothetical protein
VIAAASMVEQRRTDGYTLPSGPEAGDAPEAGAWPASRCVVPGGCDVGAAGLIANQAIAALASLLDRALRGRQAFEVEFGADQVRVSIKPPYTPDLLGPPAGRVE